MLPSLVSNVAENVTFAVDGVLLCCVTVKVAPVSGFFSTQVQTDVDDTWACQYSIFKCLYSGTYMVSGTISDHIRLEQVRRRTCKQVDKLRLEQFVPLLASLSKRSTKKVISYQDG